METVAISVVIPTYNREKVLIESILYLNSLNPRPAEILLVDQTSNHEQATIDALDAMVKKNEIRLIKRTEPSIPKAMNQGLRLAENEIVLFLDDDIRPEPELLSAHWLAHQAHQNVIVAGRVIQPWEEDMDFSRVPSYSFAGLNSAWIKEFMGGNFSINRNTALALGGFDENFVRSAYRFEAEFAYRWCQSGLRILFEPSACIHHLKNLGGGIRAYGNHLETWKPDHVVGAYYYGFRTRNYLSILIRPFRAVRTRYHLRRPWRIPITLCSELLAFFWALRLHIAGPRYVSDASE